MSDIAVSELLERFRAVGKWDSIGREEAADLEEMLATAREPRFPGAILPLPRRDGFPIYYGMAESSSDWRALRAWLFAFAGPTVSSFMGWPHTLDPNDEAEKLLAAGTFHAVARIESGPDTSRLLRRSLRQLTRTTTRMPDVAFVSAEPRHRIIRQFFNNVAAGELEAALECVSSLRRDLRLDTLNLAFLEVHARATVGDWRGIVNMREFLPLLHARKPASITQRLLEALYHTHLAGAVDAGNATDAIDRYRKDWRPLIGGLTNFPATGGSDELARLYAIDSLSRDGERTPWCEALKSYDLGSLAQPWSKAFPVGVTPQAQETVAEPNRLDEARAALINSGVSDTLDTKRVALAKVAALTDDEQSALFRTTWARKLWEELIRQVGERPPGDWPSWLQRLSSTAFGETAEDVARAAVSEWSHEGAFSDPPSFSDTLRTSATAEVAPILSQGLPHLVTWLRADPEGPRTSWRSIYIAVVDAYSLTGELDAAAREATLPMIELALETEPGITEYRDLVEQADMLTGDDPGVHGAWWPLKVADMLLWYRAPDTDARAHFLSQLLEKLRTSLPRLTPGQRHVAWKLAQAIEWPWPEVENTATKPNEVALADKLGGKTLAVYTLVERAGEQARSALAALTPTTRVELCADHVATPRLVSLARNADVFVMVTGAAKHAATDAIKRERPKDKPLLMPFGRGASSVLEAIDRWAGFLHQRN